MPSTTPPEPRRLDIRKYANRRFYDATRSKPITQEEIHQLIRNGHEVRVTDPKSGEDITVRVLAQIILDMDGPKLAVFPVELLHRLIQSNETLMHDFVDKYFNQALMLFLESRKKFEEQLRSATGLAMAPTQAFDWARMMSAPFLPQFSKPQKDTAEGSTLTNERTQELERALRELQERVQSLQKKRTGGSDRAKRGNSKRRSRQKTK
jgi:polyhydroxyalkanoate synthesis repressor PhaR